MVVLRGVFTPLACEYRHERIRAIGKQLAQGDHDVALLQEVRLSDSTIQCFLLNVLTI